MNSKDSWKLMAKQGAIVLGWLSMGISAIMAINTNILGITVGIITLGASTYYSLKELLKKEE